MPALSVEVDELDEPLRRVRFAKVPIDYGPVEERWEIRPFPVRDPFGQLINILAHPL